jgi:regulator of protease activity HflC (stomatin/prohibitin superfamily)
MIESAFAWITDFVMWLASLVPRWRFTRSTHEGVAYLLGKYVRHWKAGAHFYWPPITDFDEIPVVRQTMDLPEQTITTKDLKTVLASAVITYRISDVVVALSQQWDYEDTIRDLSQAALRDYVCEREFEAIATQRRHSGKQMATMANDELKEWGVEVINMRLQEFAITKAVSLHGQGGGYVPDDEEEE